MSFARRFRRARERAKHGAPLRKIAGRRAREDRAKGCRKCAGYGWLIENLPEEEPRP